ERWTAARVPVLRTAASDASHYHFTDVAPSARRRSGSQMVAATTAPTVPRAGGGFHRLMRRQGPVRSFDKIRAPARARTYDVFLHGGTRTGGVGCRHRTDNLGMLLDSAFCGRGMVSQAKQVRVCIRTRQGLGHQKVAALR